MRSRGEQKCPPPPYPARLTVFLRSIHNLPSEYGRWGRAWLLSQHPSPCPRVGAESHLRIDRLGNHQFILPEIVQTFENLAVENNYEILITTTVHDPKRMESSVRRMIERRLDGVPILTFGMEESLIEHLRFRIKNRPRCCPRNGGSRVSRFCNPRSAFPERFCLPQWRLQLKEYGNTLVCAHSEQTITLLVMTLLIDMHPRRDNGVC